MREDFEKQLNEQKEPYKVTLKEVDGDIRRATVVIHGSGNKNLEITYFTEDSKKYIGDHTIYAHCEISEIEHKKALGLIGYDKRTKLQETKFMIDFDYYYDDEYSSTRYARNTLKTERLVSKWTPDIVFPKGQNKVDAHLEEVTELAKTLIAEKLDAFFDEQKRQKQQKDMEEQQAKEVAEQKRIAEQYDLKQEGFADVLERLKEKTAKPQPETEKTVTPTEQAKTSATLSDEEKTERVRAAFQKWQTQRDSKKQA